MSDVAALLAGIGAMLSGLAAVWAVVRTAPKGSDRESERAVSAAVEAQQPDNITVIEPKKPRGARE